MTFEQEIEHRAHLTEEQLRLRIQQQGPEQERELQAYVISRNSAHEARLNDPDWHDEYLDK